MKRIYVISSLIALGVTVLVLGVYIYFQGDRTVKIEHVNATPAAKVLYTLDKDKKPVPLDFTEVAAQVMDAVVFIKTTQTYSSENQFERQPNPYDDFFRRDPFRDFFNPRFFESPRNQENQPRVQLGQGSGVIISEDGYIVTNNHVVANADDVEVTLNDNRTYKAMILGTDPTTDLALLQIKDKDLPVLPLVNSDEVKVGEWVLAVGNPFNLTSTVTAGIVSAKGRNINILRERFAVESFIQTDAAINPGNSGGALVNLEGGLVGINTAIASPTGAYSGYGFAIPANIVDKVVEDIIKYGVVQRGVLGVMIRTLDGNLIKEKELEVTEGVYVDSLLENSAAGSAGIKPGDVILSVDGMEVSQSSALQELIARHRPGDVVTLKILRGNKEKIYKVTLNSPKGDTKLVAKEHKEILNILGADLETLDKKKASKLEIAGGVFVKALYAGKLRKNTNMREGFIITKVDDKSVDTVEKFVEILENKKGGIMLEGIYEDIPGTYYYAFGM